MLAHGFTADQLGTMAHMGFAAQTAERVVGTFGQTSEIKRFKITEEGERALCSTVTGSARRVAWSESPVSPVSAKLAPHCLRGITNCRNCSGKLIFTAPE